MHIPAIGEVAAVRLLVSVWREASGTTATASSQRVGLRKGLPSSDSVSEVRCAVLQDSISYVVQFEEYRKGRNVEDQKHGESLFRNLPKNILNPRRDGETSTLLN
jgi:hypothetical protein